MVQENGVPVGMRNYPAQFKADAVALYHSRPGVSVASVAADLGVNTETLRSWIREADPGVAARPAPARQAPVETAVEAENRDLRRQVAELKQEREILRRAAKYFAGETNW
jgi:transposase-like protein